MNLQTRNRLSVSRWPAVAAPLCIAAAAAGQATFAPGHLVVLQIGDGSVPLSSAAMPVFLKEYTRQGVHIQTVALPSVASGSGNRALTLSGTAITEGALLRSVDGRFLTVGGYNANVGTGAVVSSPAERIAGLIAADGSVDTSTAFSDGTYSGSSFRSVVTADGSAFWMAGHAGSSTNAGVRYAELGSDVSVRLTSTPTNVRTAGIFDGQLYVSTQAGAHRGLNVVGLGLPEEPGQTTMLMPGFELSGIQPHGFFFADAQTVYVADERSLSNSGGVQKWTFDGIEWSLAYTMQTGLSSGVRHLTGIVEPAGTTLYITTTDTVGSIFGNRVMKVVDTGEFSEFIFIAIAPGDTVYRGIAFAPASACPPCYADCDANELLNIDDFLCFVNEFAQAQQLPPQAQRDHYANCDGSTSDPVLTIDDFLCFINEFSQGCPPCL